MSAVFVSSSLFKKSPRCSAVTIGGESFPIGATGRVGESLYPYRGSTRTKVAKYSYALIAFMLFKEGKLSVLTNVIDEVFYVSYSDPYSDASTRDKRFLITHKSDGSYLVAPNLPFSERTTAVVASILAMAKCDFFKMPYSEDPLLFCDAVYYGFANRCVVNFSDPDATIETQASLAYRNGTLYPYIGNVPEGFSLDGSFVKEEKTNPLPDFSYYSEGNAFLDYDWDAESKLRISPIDFLDSFVPTQAFFSVAQKVEFRLKKVMERLNNGLTGNKAIGKDYLNIRLTGNPGSGKTVLAYALSSALGLPIYTVPIQKNTEEDVFEGKNKLVKNEFSFVNTDFLNAYKNGGIIVLEEINLADPALIMGALGQAIEPPFIINENGYKKVSRHPMCVIIATQNVGTTGSRGVNQALVSRFPHTYVINDPSREEFVDRLMLRYADKDTCEWVYSSYCAIKYWLCQPEQSAEDIALALSFRACVGILEDIEEGISRREAIMKFYAIIYGESPEIAESAKAIIKSLPGM